MTSEIASNRPSTGSDAPALARVHDCDVQHSTGNFEAQAPGLQEMTARRNALGARHMRALIGKPANPASFKRALGSACQPARN